MKAKITISAATMRRIPKPSPASRLPSCSLTGELSKRRSTHPLTLGIGPPAGFRLGLLAPDHAKRHVSIRGTAIKANTKMLIAMSNVTPRFGEGLNFLLRDLDAKFPTAFDEVSL